MLALALIGAACSSDADGDQAQQEEQQTHQQAEDQIQQEQAESDDERQQAEQEEDAAAPALIVFGRLRRRVAHSAFGSSGEFTAVIYVMSDTEGTATLTVGGNVGLPGRGHVPRHARWHR